MGRISPPTPLNKDHETQGFDCGNAALNEWLIRFAWTNNQANSARTFVVCDDLKVAGYYSLAVGSVEYDDVLPRIRKELARHPVPVVILARLAVDAGYKGYGMGKGLLRDALLRILNISGQVGIRAVLVNAKTEDVRIFYEKYGFEPMPDNPLKLMLLIKDIKRIFD